MGSTLFFREERAQITDKGIRTRVLTLLSSLQEVASVVEYRSKKE